MSWTRERETLTTGAGLLDRTERSEIVDMTGEDRVRFLNGQVTCDVAKLEPGQSVYGFFVSPKGRVEADVTVLALEDRLRLELPAGRAEAIRERLAKYALVDRVETETVGGWSLVSLVGPKAGSVLRALGVEPPEEGRHRADTVAGHEAVLDARSLHGLPTVTLWVREGRDREAILGELVGAGAAPVGFEALDAVRVETGAPRYGVDYGEDNFPQETGLDDAVSYTKGCYLGQEVVARIHYRGGVNKHLRRLAVTGGRPEPGAELLYEGRPAGVLGTVAPDATGEHDALALAVLHKRAAEPGTVLEVAGEGESAVRVSVREAGPRP